MSKANLTIPYEAFNEDEDNIKSADRVLTIFSIKATDQGVELPHNFNPSLLEEVLDAVVDISDTPVVPSLPDLISFYINVPYPAEVALLAAFFLRMVLHDSDDGDFEETYNLYFKVLTDISSVSSSYA